jgi:hypothetical protein
VEAGLVEVLPQDGSPFFIVPLGQSEGVFLLQKIENDRVLAGAEAEIKSEGEGAVLVLDGLLVYLDWAGLLILGCFPLGFVEEVAGGFVPIL